MKLRAKIFVPLLLVGLGLGLYVTLIWSPRMLADAAAHHRDHHDEHLATIAQILISPMLAGDLAEVHALLDTLRADAHWRRIRLVDARGRLLYPLAEPTGEEDGPTWIDISQPVRFQNLNLGTVSAVVDISDHLAVDTAHARALQWSLLAALAAMLLTLGIILELTLRKPLVQLIGVARAIAAGDFNGSLPAPSRDEIGALITQFASMRSALYERNAALLQTAYELRAQKKALDEHAIVAIADARGMFTYVNDKFCQLSGYARDALLGMNQFFLYCGHHDEVELERIEDCLRRGEVWHGALTATRANGGAFMTDATIVPFLDGPSRSTRFIHIHTDITARRTAEQQLTRTLGRYHQLLVSSPTVIYSTVPSGDFRATYVSDNIYGVLGYSPLDVLSDPDFWHNHIHPDDRPRVFGKLPRLFVAGSHVHEYRFLHANGSYLWIHDQLRLIRDDSGIPVEVVGSLTDITQRKTLEEELIAYRDHLQELVDAQTRDLVAARDDALAAERAMSAFLANMSHELRTPLHGILSYANFGLKKIDSAGRDKLLQYFGEIRDSGRHLLELVNNLLDLSKLRAGKMSYEYGPVDLCSLVGVVQEEFTPLVQEKKLRIDCTHRNKPPTILGDTTRIGQVVRNLLSNAVKFSPHGGTITITVDGDAGGATVRVADQGVGVPDGELDAIFDAFTQSSKTRTGAGGTGLGLAICREIVTMGHGGSISAANNPTGGACFTVRLPARPPAALEYAS
jgi:PAS domain S-box-containing protein